MNILPSLFSLEDIRELTNDYRNTFCNWERRVISNLDDLGWWKANKDQYSVSINLAGTKKDNIHVELNENKIIVKVIDRIYWSSNLPQDVDQERIGVRYEDGLLTITCSKIETPKPRQIAVQ